MANLKNINIPASVTYFDWCAFEGCANLVSLAIPNSVTYIGPYAFERCANLTSVTIPDSVTELGDNAFLDCSGLHTVRFEGDAPEIGDNVFEGVAWNFKIYYDSDRYGWRIDDDGLWNGYIANPVKFEFETMILEPGYYWYTMYLIYIRNGIDLVNITHLEWNTTNSTVAPDSVYFGYMSPTDDFYTTEFFGDTVPNASPPDWTSINNMPTGWYHLILANSSDTADIIIKANLEYKYLD